MTMLPVDLAKAHRLLNHGPTVLISARHGGVDNVMAAAWASVLDMAPAKVTVVLDRASHTRKLAEASGRFVMQIPVARQLAMVDALGTSSLNDTPTKLQESGVGLFEMPGHDMPFVSGCAAWLACRILSEPHIQTTYDLFLAEVEMAWADDAVFRNGRWFFETAAPEWRSLHHVSGGRYLAIGDILDVNRSPDEGPGA
ncbi:MAG: flavin reductase [Alphaproteobacteria bacterium]|nr:MAG: flavin reductase [Alphaproteobacteria bacterium]